MAVRSKEMKELAQEVAKKLQFARWQDDMITREIAEAQDPTEAMDRLEQIRNDVEVALETVQERLDEDERGESNEPEGEEE